MKECDQQCSAIKRGICQVCPEALLNMVSYQEIEEWVCGRKFIDIDLLRRHTEYAGIDENSEVVGWFWEILHEMA